MVRIINELNLNRNQIKHARQIIKNLKYVEERCHLTASLDRRGGGGDGSVVAQARRRRSVTGGFGLKNSEANGERCEEEEDETP